MSAEIGDGWQEIDMSQVKRRKIVRKCDIAKDDILAFVASGKRAVFKDYPTRRDAYNMRNIFCNVIRALEDSYEIPHGSIKTHLHDCRLVLERIS